MGTNCDLSVSFYRHFAQSLLFTIPAGHDVQFIYCNHLLLRISYEGIIYSQGFVNEIVVEVLCQEFAWHHEHSKSCNDQCFLLHFLFFISLSYFQSGSRVYLEVWIKVILGIETLQSDAIFL